MLKQVFLAQLEPVVAHFGQWKPFARIVEPYARAT